MKFNVFIVIKQNGKVIGHRRGHNIWVDNGRNYLAKKLADENDYGVKHIGFGIGGNKQALLPLVNSSPIVDAYPAGFDPNATTGNEHNIDYPIDPLISTLERPVRISGNSKPYATADPGDVWLVSPPPLGFLTTFVPSTPAETTEGSVDLVGAFPGTLNGKTLTLKTVDDGMQFAFVSEQTVTFSTPADAAAVISQIEAQATVNAELGTSNGLILASLTAGATAKIQITGGTALIDLGVVTESASGNTPGRIFFRTLIDTTAGDILDLGGPNGPFLQMPLSEIGLFLSSSDVNDPYNTLVAYHTFGTILLTEDTQLEIFWRVSF